MKTKIERSSQVEMKQGGFAASHTWIPSTFTCLVAV